MTAGKCRVSLSGYPGMLALWLRLLSDAVLTAVAVRRD